MLACAALANTLSAKNRGLVWGVKNEGEKSDEERRNWTKNVSSSLARRMKR